MDLGSAPAIVTTIKTAIEIAKLLKNSDDSLEKVEAKQRLVEIISALVDAKSEIIDMQQLLIGKDGEVRALQEKLKIKAQLQWESPYYW